VIWNNVRFDRPERFRSGAFNAVSNACLSGGPNPVPADGGTITPAAGICGNQSGSVIPQIMSFWKQVLAGNPFNPQNPNPNCVGTSLSQGLGVPDPALFAPNYQPPRSVEINFGIRRELRHGMVFRADYLRNIETRNLPNFGYFNLPPNTMNGIVLGPERDRSTTRRERITKLSE